MAFKSSLVSVSNELLANGFISSEVHDKVLSPGLGDDVKASMLVRCVTDAVCLCPRKYHDFMKLPLFKEQWTKELYEFITAKYGKRWAPGIHVLKIKSYSIPTD